MTEPQQGGRAVRARGERGAARLNLLIVLALVGVAGYAAYNYAPVAYRAFLFKDFMEETVEKATVPPGQSLSWVEAQLRAKAEEYGIPDDAVYTVENRNNHVAARVRFTRPLSMPGFIYDYAFDHTATSRGFISK